eukprot:TRINITY_DN105454_c0_g1_i1.p1 TRINITY_DN105454_c0_g1~~TRINITY_DN105454_c0_g1_i1.p1  ORF type:complete len:285 (-),score=41.55 TRINITY_DN105454_c0_g1_i1:53-907(-)
MDLLEVHPSRIWLHHLVGEGATAQVFKGYLDGEVAAVKQIDLKLCSDREQREFDREVDVLCNMKHPNIIAFFGICSMQWPKRILTEYCAGASMFELLHRTDVELAMHQRCAISKGIVRGMAFLHAHSPPVLHRDLKSPNILLSTPVTRPSDAPVVKIADFGVARCRDDDSRCMTVGIGTSNWMAPEVICTSDYTEKVDIYSFGMVLYEIMLNKIPFEHEAPATIIHFVVGGSRPCLQAWPRCHPEMLRDTIRLCWAQRPRKRPDFNQLAVILDGCFGDCLGCEL